MRKRIHRGISRRFVLVSRTGEQLSYLAPSAVGGLPTACEFYSRKYVNPITGELVDLAVREIRRRPGQARRRNAFLTVARPCCAVSAWPLGADASDARRRRRRKPIPSKERMVGSSGLPRSR